MRNLSLIRYTICFSFALLLSQTSTSNQATTAANLHPTGNWSDMTNWPVLPIHSIVAASGELLTFGAVPGGSATGVGGKDYDVWNPLTNTHTTIPQVNHDYFCSATVTMPDSGDIMITGGDDFVPGSTGIELLTFFNPPSNSLTSGSPMYTPRWYPTATVLSNGEILVTGGTIQSFSDNVHAITPEIYNQDTGWRELTGATSTTAFGQQTRFWYPRVWAAPNGKAFGIAQDLMFWLDPDANNGNGSIDIIGQLPSVYRGNATSSAVMFEPGKILQIGGGAKTNVDNGTDALKSAVIIDINGSAPVLTPAPDMNYRRHWANATVLPNGTVLVNGGARVNNKYTGVAYASEIWDPATGSWTEVASEAVPRLYHASSVLLPDGRVFSGGGGNPGPAKQHNAQFFTPGYLLNSNGSLASRPVIQWVQYVAGYSSDITTVVGVGQAIARVTLVRSSSTTHSFNMDQRFIELGFSQSGQTLTIATPTTSLIAPPGYYLLSVIDTNGVVSESSILQLGSYNVSPADTTIPYAEATFPVDDSNINAGVSDISGIASDAGSGVNKVLVRIQRIGTTPSLFWSESGWGNTSTWHDASVEDTADPDNFTWTLPNVDLTVAADYRVLVRAFDNAGNHATANNNFKTVFTVKTDDNIIPYAEATFPANNSDINASVSDIFGIASDADSGVNKVLVRIQRIGATPSLFWSENGWSNTSTWLDASVENTNDPNNFTWNLDNVDLTFAADYRILVRAFDNAGNHATANNNFKTVFTVKTDDTTIPYAEATFPANNSDINAGVSDISGVASDADSGVRKVLVRIQRIGASPSLFWSESGWSDTSTWLVASVENTADPQNFTWNLPNVDLTVAANYRVLVRAFDNAGNQATANNNFKTVFTVAAGL